jgi:DNA modification methylase
VLGAIKNNRNAIGIEKEEAYCKIANQRIKSFKEGTLKIRPMTKAIFQPTGNEKVSQMPTEWMQLKISNNTL